MGDDFDAIVVGAGMAGSSAAIRLAQGKANVLLVERGAEPGVKNLSGGILWGHDLDRILPNWWQDMPVERHIVRKRFGLMTRERAVSFEYSDAAWTKPSYVAHSVLRARTDAWLTAQAERAGATVVTGVPVEKLLWEGRSVRGIVQGGEPMTAPVTILADGMNSRLALGTAIRPSPRLSEKTNELGIKEVFRLPRSTLEERFGLSGLDGHAEEWVPGFFPEGVMGGGFLYTNQDTISLGLVVRIGSLYGRAAKSHDLLEAFKLHSAIAPRLDGAELVEYGAKIIPSGWASRPTSFHGDGWMVAGDAAGFLFANGIVIQGMNYAVHSGIEAAETALEARSNGSRGPNRLAAYTRRLEATGLLGDFRGFAGLDAVKWNERIYSTYPGLAAELARRLLLDPPLAKKHVRRHLLEIARGSKVPLTTLVRDGLSILRNL
jgi:electron transfer flavoprotein-quinone oxidoreductase